MESNQLQNFVFNQPKVFAERKKAAGILVDRLKYRMPLAIDTMDNRTDKAYAAWPERIYILGTDGKVRFKGDTGPFGFHSEEAEKALAAIVPARAAAAR